MKKKLLAVAVAGALAAPGLALAQSSVTISGIFKMSLENLKIPGRVGVNTSETRISDDSSRIIFNVVEDLGGGLQAIGQVDMRINMTGGATATDPQSVVAASGNTHVGFRSKTMGRIFLGRQDLHYFNRESNLTDLAGTLRADSISLISFVSNANAPGTTVAIAGATRTPNVIHYTSPSWGGFTVVAAYSTGPTTASTTTGQGDLASAIRKGSAWNLNPNFASGNWQAGWSYWQSKPDVTAATLATGDQRSNRLYGSFRIAGFKLGLAWDKSRVRSQATGANIAERTAWSLPLSYTMGNNQFHFHYTRARDDRATAASDGAKMVALSYQYTLSKRTSLGLTYAKITNDAAAAYNFFTSTSLGSSTGAAVASGEDPRLFAGTIRHAF